MLSGNNTIPCDYNTTTDSNIKLFEKLNPKTHFDAIYKTFDKCSKEGDLYSIQYGIELNFQNCRDINGRCIIHQAAYQNNLSLVKDLIKCGVDINSRTHNNNTPLIYACMTSSKSVVNYLVSLNEIDINAQNEKCNTALHYACICNMLDIVNALLQTKRTDVKIRNKAGKIASELTRDGNILSALLKSPHI
ncbi:hypothetical protein TVAG_071130 [Trichomonas vaginalis G3]|uniref:Uncharacterized protein n=1 Tax=Trichomonas vaginalis (strain ATCC PRA-98 / G3) TaxID=412133 RepID=A2D816_TRIV3|nr:protein ubiquitination [Trichomonas vaginalis G3]EAY23449.1 hypothetical protein TVAG_071130 [Trichomonas vaginalis G3]KAI5493862.1 protein ubiquitination [Trichomonas vaginalis G3]|eukprot:XP_001584435.1 hypothetical protein [Trichomonas vaginalis G3]